MSESSKKYLNVAVQGCSHDHLADIYTGIAESEKATGEKVDVLLICGDFQAMRNESDLETLACPPKYRSLNSFHKYYHGEVEAPVLTIFIGGNHEASGYLRELFYGGWAAPNVYYLGVAGVVNIGGLRIAGWSGIFKNGDFNKGYFEKLPFDRSSMRSIYHIRAFEKYKFQLLKEDVDVMLSHDWPNEITHYGNQEALLKWKPYFRDEIASNTLGSPHSMDVLKTMQPRYWFSAHLHCKFAAVYNHNSEDIDAGEKETRFLALDKCLPGKDYLQILRIETDKDVPRDDETGSFKLCYDIEWLAVTKKTHPQLSTRSCNVFTPHMDSPEFVENIITEEDKNEIKENLKSHGIIEEHGYFPIPLNFRKTAVPPQVDGKRRAFPQPERNGNNQTDELLNILSLPHIVTVPDATSSVAGEDNQDDDDDEEIDLDI
eukprot:TRINITY_DN774129_c0_g1_i1.p1 TRINITY_DN774129_c0_g1~~TRINITY_DN774129_c0_g1_i1.p1  ORF type:complete len:431 (-),score=111.79 TRINITY_DN774129_c0_g1_i1:148-1440(-)